MTTKPNPSRRAMIGALAALPVASVPAIAGVAAMDDPDPIFGLIEAAKHATAMSAASNFDDEKLSKLQWAAELTALKAQPCTAAGAAALLLYLADSIAEWEPNSGDILPAVVNAARVISGPQVVSKRVQEALDGKIDHLCASELPARGEGLDT
jgi:hypothetical protein